MRCPSVSEKSVVRVDQNMSEKKLMLFRSPLDYELSVLFDEFRRSSQKIIFPLFFFFLSRRISPKWTAPSVDVPNFRALFFFSTSAKDSPIRRVYL